MVSLKRFQLYVIKGDFGSNMQSNHKDRLIEIANALARVGFDTTVIDNAVETGNARILELKGIKPR